MHDPDRALVERTLAGDLGAFETLVERHGGVAYRIAARIAGPDEAEDITQDAFLRAFHRLSRFRAEGSFRAWLLQIVHNTALNVRAGRRSEPREEVESLVEAAADELERTPAERLDSKVRMLQPAHRAVLVLRDLEGMSYEEIAAVTETPLGSVKGRLHRARRELIQILRENTYDWGLPK